MFKIVLSELFADFGSVKVFMRCQKGKADTQVPEHRTHTSGYGTKPWISMT